jgi:hypothetical protein
MGDNTLVILGVCGAALVFMAIGAFLFFWVTRSLNRFFIVGLVRRLIGGVDEYTDKDDETVGGYVSQRARRDLRAKAQSLDFDSAVARHRGEPVPPTDPADASAQPLTTQNTTPTTNVNSPSLRSRTNRRKRPNDDNLDEVFGGMLDTDGDGDMDF